MRGEAHDGGRPSADFAVRDCAEALEHRHDLLLVDPFCEIEEAESTMELGRQRRDLLDLKHRGANGGGIQIPHHLDGA